jgi:arylsulfotransferase ASST
VVLVRHDDRLWHRHATDTLGITDRNAHPVSAVITGLEPETTYHFRLCAQSVGFTSCGVDRSFTTTQAEPTALSIKATPDLHPQFDPQVSDYVTRCGSDPVTVDVAAPPGTEVAVDNQPARSGRFSQTVALSSGQDFALSTVDGGQTRTFHVRCLPSDFPTWTFTRSAQSSQAWTLLALTGQRYVTFFDGDGVPVWWYRSDGGPIDARVLSDDTVAFARSCACPFGTPDTSYEIRRLDGTLVRSVRTVDVDTDHHDLQEVGNGNLLLAAYVPRDNVDLSAFGGPSDATVQDAVIQELAPDGSLVWSWNSKDHIGLSEADPWWGFLKAFPTQLPDGRTAYDVVHFNAVEPDGDGLLVSMRHTDAIYRISRSDGHVEWKLGGTTTPQSLTVSGDDQATPFGGQHDVRRLGDGTVTIHDNGTQLGRSPRAVRFRIDPAQQAATLAEQLSDPDVTSSNCCGSARKLDSGGWLMGWGTLSTNPTIAEYASDHSRVFKLTFSGAFSYRAFPVPRGRISAEQLRQAMDSMHPR